MLTEVASTTNRSVAGPIVVSIVVLAGLDLVGALLARHWAEHRTWMSFAAGVVVFASLFAVYALSLEHASLTTVTMGWIVMLQVGVILIDRFQGGSFTMDRTVAIMAMLALQGYLIVGEGSPA